MLDFHFGYILVIYLMTKNTVSSDNLQVNNNIYDDLKEINTINLSILILITKIYSICYQNTIDVGHTLLI